MSELKIRQFCENTGATRTQAIYFLEKYSNDLAKASSAYMNASPAERTPQNIYYAGGEKSGVAIVMPSSADDLMPMPMPVKKPAPPPPSFTGAARTLSSGGAPAPQTVVLSGPFTPKRTDYTVTGQAKTRLRIELPNGQAVNLSVSTQATVSDLKGYIVENYPDAEGKPMTLAVTVPPKMLDDDTATIESAGLARAVIKCTC